MVEPQIFELHHQVLTAWAGYRRKRAVAPAALTLDFHTDTLPAFGRRFPSEPDRLRAIAAFDYRNDRKVAAGLTGLQHDEQIDLALKSGIISCSAVVSYFDNPGCADPRIAVAAPPEWPPLPEFLNFPAKSRPLADQFLETPFLAEQLQRAKFVPEEHPGFILDVDLDCFLTVQAAQPRDRKLWRKLLSLAGLITVSREREWLRLLRFDRELEPEKLIGLLFR